MMINLPVHGLFIAYKNKKIKIFPKNEWEFLGKCAWVRNLCSTGKRVEHHRIGGDEY
jgi:hypothetical protein